MDIKKLLQTFDVLSEGTMKSAEKQSTGPEFTGYWTGKDKATPGKKMVGGESIMPELARQAKDGKPQRRLMTDWQEFKESQEEFVLYIDGKPASKYTDHAQAHKDLEYIRSRYPNKQVELKQEICNLKTLPEGKLPDEYTLKQPQEQTLNDVLFQTAAQAMVNASREGEHLDTEDAIKQASQVTKIPYVPSQLPALYAQLQKLEQQIATQRQVRKNQLGREKEKLTHQTTPDEERRAQEFAKQHAKAIQDRLTLRSEDLEEADVKPVSAVTPIQQTKTNPKQTVHVSKENPAAIIDINKHWARGDDGFEGEIVSVTDTEYTLSDGHQNRVYNKEQVTILESKDLEEFAPPLAETGEPNTVTVDIPLLIRLLEYAREDAKTDMDLHNVAEQMIQLSQNGETLSMDHYVSIVDSKQEVSEYGANANQMANTQAQSTTGDPKKAAEIVQTNKSVQNLKPVLQAAGGDNIDANKLTQTLAKLDTDPNAQLSGQDLSQLGNLAPTIADIAKNPQTAQQFKQLAQKATSLK